MLYVYYICIYILYIYIYIYIYMHTPTVCVYLTSRRARPSNDATVELRSLSQTSSTWPGPYLVVTAWLHVTSLKWSSKGKWSSMSSVHSGATATTTRTTAVYVFVVVGVLLEVQNAHSKNQRALKSFIPSISISHTKIVLELSHFLPLPMQCCYIIFIN